VCVQGNRPCAQGNRILVCDTRMVARTIVMCVQYACAQLFGYYFKVVISCVMRLSLGVERVTSSDTAQTCD
jgi:hypothetical protein